MKFFFSLCCFFCAYSLVQAQNIDSLKQAVITNSHDTDRVKTLLRLSNAYSNFERDTAMQYAQDALNLAQQNGFKKGEAQSLNIIGSILTGIGNYLRAFEYHLEALKIAEKIKNQTLIAAVYNNLARVSTERSDFNTALEYLFKAKSIFEQLDIKEYVSDALLNIGDNYERMSRLDSAFFYQNQAYQLALQIDYTYNLGTIVSNLGSIHSKMNKTDTAIAYFKSAVQLMRSSENTNDKEALAGVYYGISKIFEEKGNSDSALLYAKQSLALSMQIGDQKRILNASKLLNQVYETKKMIDSAYRYSKIANETRELILSADKVGQLENMKITEQIRQQELARVEAKTNKERKNNLQLFGIALFIINFFVILVIVSRRKAHPKALKYLGLLGLLLLFEFIAVFIHPYIDRWTNHNPVYMLLILVAVGAILVPLHHNLEQWVKVKLTKDSKENLKKDRETPSQQVDQQKEKVEIISPKKVVPPTQK